MTNKRNDNSNYVVTNSSEVSKVFLFAADNTDVEWSLQGFSDGDSRNYILGTMHLANKVSDNFGKTAGFFEKNMFFDLHSHPSIYEDIRGASGADRIDKQLYGDMKNVTDRYYRFIYNYNKKLPPHCVYHRNSKVLYQYTPWESNRKIGTISSYSILNNILKIK